MSKPVQDPPPTDMPPSVNDPGPSTAINVFDDAIEYRKVKYHRKIMPIDQAYKEAVKQVDQGLGYWGKKNVTLPNKTTFDFKLTCRAPCLVQQGDVSFPCTPGPSRLASPLPCTPDRWALFSGNISRYSTSSHHQMQHGALAFRGMLVGRGS